MNEHQSVIDSLLNESTADKSTSDAILDGLVTDWLDVQAALEKHGRRKDDLAEQIAARLPIGGRHEIVPGVGVRMQAPAARFDPKKATEILAPEQLAAISESKPSATLAKKFLPGVLVEQLTSTTGSPSVRSL